MIHVCCARKFLHGGMSGLADAPAGKNGGNGHQQYFAVQKK
jgi:hypothetical protein